MYLKTAKGIIKGKLTKKCVPLKVEHIITHRCNFKCNYCHLWKLKTPELNTNQIKRLMNHLSKKGTVSWNFTGGEPLLRKDIKELIEHAKKLKFYITLNTNGSLIKENLSWLKDVDLLGISLDAIEEHKKTRDKTFKEIIEKVKLLKNKNVHVYICCVLNKYNLKNNCEELKKLLGLCKEIGISLSPLPLFESNLEDNNLIPTKSEFKNGIKFLINYKKRNSKTLLVSKSTLRYLAKNFPLPPIKCYAGKYFCTIHPDGKISSCMFSQQFRSLEELRKKGRIACNITGFNCQLCYLEYNNLFSLKPGTIYELIKNK
ncbi:MAG: radical SAM protein [Promethearchaeota archaeon]